MENKRFFKCNICGNIIGKIFDSGVPVVCCGQPMEAFELQTVDGPHEKHKPVITIEGNKVVVTIGSVLHPMVPEHFIDWIYLETEKGGQRKALARDSQPVVEFMLTSDDKAVAAYSYCNLHGLWYTEV